MFAPQNQQPTVIDAMSSSQVDWYQSIDDAVKVSDIVSGHYETTTSIAYGNVGPITEGNDTSLDITCGTNEVITLDNSCIVMKQTVNLIVPKEIQNSCFKRWYIGYKSSADIIDAYRFFLKR